MTYIYVNTKKLTKAIQNVMKIVENQKMPDAYSKLYFVIKDGEAEIATGDFADAERIIQIPLEGAEVYEDGVFAIDWKDLKILTKIKDNDVELQVTNNGYEINILTKKRKVNIQQVGDANDDIFKRIYGKSDYPYAEVATLPAEDFLETTSNLKRFASKDNYRPTLKQIYINTVEDCFEALDGYRTARRYIPDTWIKNQVDPVYLNSNISDYLKGVINKDANISIYCYQDTLYVTDGTFKYYEEMPRGDYLHTENLYKLRRNYSELEINIPVADTIEVLDYYKSNQSNQNVKKEKSDDRKEFFNSKDTVMLFDKNRSELNFYYRTRRMESIDKIHGKIKNTGDAEYAKFLRHSFLLDCLQVANNVGEEEVTLKYNGVLKDPFIVAYGDYEYYILPVNPKAETDGLEKLRKEIA